MSKIKDKFTHKIFRNLWTPAMIASIGWAFSDMADAIVVGQSLGTTGLAAISLILPVYMINCLFAHSLGLGGSIHFSKSLGNGDKAKASHNFNQIFMAGLLLSICFAVFGNIFMDQLLAVLGTTSADGDLYLATKSYLRIFISSSPFFFLSNILNYYLRNDDKPKRASIGSATGNILDICLNIVFVLFLNLGTAGAALATLSGQVIAISIYLPALFGKSTNLSIKLSKIDFKEIISSFVSGFYTSVQYLFQWIFFLICNNVLIRMSGETGVAVFDMIQNASYLILYIYEGTSRAMQPLASTYHGEHFHAGKKNTLRLSVIYGSITGLIAIAFIMIFPSTICTLFGIQGTEAESLAYFALRIYCFGAFFAGILILLSNYYSSCEKGTFAFWISALRGGVILIPCTIIFSVIGGNLFWWLFPITEVSSFIIIMIVLYRQSKKPSQDNDEHVYSITIASDHENLSSVFSEVEEFCEKYEVPMKTTYFVTMSVEEVIMAIMEKGFKDRTDGNIQLTLIESKGEFIFCIRDDAIAFNPFSLETDKANLDDDFDMNAMGIKVIRSKSKDFFYRQYQGFNSLIVKI